jgi:L-lactate dehydrogenase complex protein LldG
VHVDSELNGKAAILRRIREANRTASNSAPARDGWNAISRSYKRSGTLARQDMLDRFERRLQDYDASVVRCEERNIASSVAERLISRRKSRILVPSGIPREWLPDGFAFSVDRNLTPEEMDAFGGVLTSSTLAIAETGTVVLQSVSGQGRRAASLVPDYHLCVVFADVLVETVPEAMHRLQETATLATTFISGPSATADIEMTRIKGVHGPRVLDVLLIV